ncbi:MAG: hypothetical protein ACKVT0_01680 [Planctomycetaceae bacterium]
MGGSKVVTVEKTEYSAPPSEDDGLEGDRLADKQNRFDPELIDRRPLEDWQINLSEAVISLNIALAKPDRDAKLLVLQPSYSDAISAAEAHRKGIKLLPSVNMIDGKAKQFDDGMYAAIDQAYFIGIADRLQGHLDLFERLSAKLDPSSRAAAYIAAGLTMGGRGMTLDDPKLEKYRKQLIQRFNTNRALSKPIGFYTWNNDLKRCWAFLRFFQQPPPDISITAELVKVLEQDTALAADCQRAAQFFGKMTNPLEQLTIVELIGKDLASDEAKSAAFFPLSTSRETELYRRLFPNGLPEGANLMKELIHVIRSGEVDLAPQENSGWYDHQVYALETMLLPERGEEHNKLLLTKPYKKRMLDAFRALMTKRRETHIRQFGGVGGAASPRELEGVAPRLRVEPCPSFYVRTARSYSFLHDFLVASLGEETLRSIHGLRQNGARSDDLLTELVKQRDLFYGLYLVSSEDIGHQTMLADGELADPESCYAAATTWLEAIADEPDLAEDSRVVVPIYVDPIKGTSRLWMTLGIRLSTLEAKFATSPSIKPVEGEGEWKKVQEHKLEQAIHLIAVDEFAEVEVPTTEPPTREEFRKLCDKYKTKDKIIKALSRGEW